MDEQTPGRGKGNFTVGRPQSTGNRGKETPNSLTNLSRTRALEKVIPQYNAEASYNDYSNHKAAGHLSELHQTLGMLHGTSESRTSRVLQSRVAALGDAATTHGFTIHPDIVQGVKDIGQSLSAMDPSELPEHAKEHHAAALEAASNFVRTAEPAYEPTSTGYKGTTGQLGSGRMAVNLEPDYRANIFDYPQQKSSAAPTPKEYEKEMKATTDGRYALVKQGKKANPEASRTPEQKAAKAERRKAASAAARAAKGSK